MSDDATPKPHRVGFSFLFGLCLLWRIFLGKSDLLEFLSHRTNRASDTVDCLANKFPQSFETSHAGCSVVVSKALDLVCDGIESACDLMERLFVNGSKAVDRLGKLIYGFGGIGHEY